MQARLEEARNTLADEALAYYPEVSFKTCYRKNNFTGVELVWVAITKISG
jgi:hypothetical protein